MLHRDVYWLHGDRAALGWRSRKGQYGAGQVKSRERKIVREDTISGTRASLCAGQALRKTKAHLRIEVIQ
jgi:hypothetical protein